MNSSHNNSDILQHSREEGDIDHNQNVILRSLPPAKDVASNFLQCCSCFDMGFLLMSKNKQSYVCQNSHSICFQCLSELGSNGCQFRFQDGNICNKTFVKFPEGAMDIFNYLRQESQFSCPYWDAGCKQMVIGRSLEFHLEKECVFRPLSSCIFTDCPEKRIVMSDFVNHIEYDHLVGVELGNRFKIQIPFSENEIRNSQEVRFAMTLMECYDSQFVVVMQETEDKYFIWVVQCTSKNALRKRRRNYGCRVELHDRFQFCHKRIRELVGVWETMDLKRFWEFPIHSIYRPVEEIIHLGECFEVYKKTLSDNTCFYLSTRKDGLKFWSIEIIITEMIAENGIEFRNSSF